MTNQSFEALSRMCLNNWHYISRKTLSFNQEINFFTGHSGSGKSTVLDALQIILYANTDGRAFFNKAAADDSDRSLIEYLRGMINIGEDNEFSYLRNKNFSSTIVLELKRTDTGECQCVGVAFDVDVATNQVSRIFFWHRSALPEHEYRTDKGCMSIDEVRKYLQKGFSKEDYYYGSHNERFRRQLYDIYLGGLDMEKFPLLFKRAIPFRMNIRLEDFVKEYICTEQDIHIEDMQESVMQYGRMRKKIEDTYEEIRKLQDISKAYEGMAGKHEEMREYQYISDKMDILFAKQKLSELSDKISFAEAQIKRQEKEKEELDEKIGHLSKRSDQLLVQISNSGYDKLKEQMEALNDFMEHLDKSRARWERTAGRLKEWAEQDITSNSTIWDIEKFEEGTITAEDLARLKKSIKEMREEVKEQEQEAASLVRSMKKQEKALAEDLKQLKQGKKAYPRELEYARSYIQRRLLEETKKPVSVDILADLLDIRQEQWRNAVEGYLGGNKLSIIVEPKYAKAAMKIYQELDRKEYFRVAVLDTERVSEAEHPVLENALSHEVISRVGYVQSYIDFILGKVEKCEDLDQLRSCKIGITPDCVLYHSCRLQYINPEQYTRGAYIGSMSMKKRIRQIEDELKELELAMLPQTDTIKECKAILELEDLAQPKEEYMGWLSDMEKGKAQQKEQKRLQKKLEELKLQKVSAWEQERIEVMAQKASKEEESKKLAKLVWTGQKNIEELQKYGINLNAELVEKEKFFETEELLEKRVKELLEERPNPRYDKLRDSFGKSSQRAAEQWELEYDNLQEIRMQYLKQYPNRNFSVTIRENTPYDKLLERLQCDDLESFKGLAAEQARSAIKHFKDDFMYKIRSAIKDALDQKDELNRIISRLDFGKDKYEFVIGKNKGADGQYYDMFMDESLEISPDSLTKSLDNQMDFFTMEHENHYETMINDLISTFIPPDNATHEQLEEAKRNMAKYSDYRTYLSFDMQQIISGDETIKIQLSRMLKKNSGGEGQNPLYVALLASFAQAYRINLSAKVKRNPTIRLVVLDEAFSKMDGEKVASCIELIRGLGFQAIISATNDKIQNYLENVDKTFVFANPNKKAISIQEFEKKDFADLMNEDE